MADEDGPRFIWRGRRSPLTENRSCLPVILHRPTKGNRSRRKQKRALQYAPPQRAQEDETDEEGDGARIDSGATPTTGASSHQEEFIVMGLDGKRSNVNGFPTNLLSMPVPKDRSHRARLIEERSTNRSLGVYNGEVEPVGYRGDEATVPEQSPRSQEKAGELTMKIIAHEPAKNAPIMRSFDSNRTRSSLIIPSSSMDSQSEEGGQSDAMQQLRAQQSSRINNNRQVAGILKRTSFPITDQRKDNGKSRKQVTSNRKGSHPFSRGIRPSRSSSAGTSSTQESSTAKTELDSDADSTQSSETLRLMLEDLLDMGGEGDSTQVSSVSTPHAPDIVEMGQAAQKHVENGEFDLALVIYGQLLGIFRRKYGDKHPSVASTYHNLGIVHSHRVTNLVEDSPQHKHVRQQSLECFQAAARIARDSLGRNHPNVAVSLVKIGFLLLHEHQYEPARVTFQEALRIREVHYGHNPHPLVANLYNNLGICHLHLKQFEKSRVWLDKALQIQRHVLRVERLQCSREELRIHLLEVADTLSNLGGLGLEWLRESSDEKVAREAETHLLEAVEIRATVLGREHTSVGQLMRLYEMIKTVFASPLTATKPLSTPIFACARPVIEEKMERNQSSPGLAVRLFSSSKLQDSTLRRVGSESSRDSLDPPGPNASEELAAEELAEEIASDVTAKAPEESFESTNAIMLNSMNHSQKPNKVTPETLRPGENGALSMILDEPPIEEILLGEKLASNRSPDRAERTKIWMNPHYVPRQSPERSPFDESHAIASGKVGIDEDAMPSMLDSYETEETCLINRSRNRVDLLSPMLLPASTDDEDEVNLSSHEIMVVRPSSTKNPSTDTLSVSSWMSGSTPTNFGADRGNRYSEEYNEGIAQISGIEEIDPTQELVLEDEFLDHPEEHVAELHLLASRCLKGNQLSEALHLFRSVLDCQRVVHGELHENVGASLHNVGLVRLRLNQHRRAQECFERAVRVRKGALGRDHPDVAVSLVKVGITLLLQHSFDMALQAFREALSVRKHAMGTLHPSIARIYNNIGCVHVEFNEMRDARRAFEAALDIQRNALCYDPSSGALIFGAATTLCNLGYLYQYRNAHDKAAIVLKEALMLQEKIFGLTHPTVISTMDCLADALSASNDCVQALRFYKETLTRLNASEDTENKYGAEATVLYRMSQVHRKQNDQENALNNLQFALQAVHASGEKKRMAQLEELIMEDMEQVRKQFDKAEYDWI